ncbi:MAG: SWIM zinc finger family protein [Candidatus Eremiobacterota bacterium]
MSWESYSDEALAELTSPGLVRRARKDLERSPPERLADSLYRVEGFEVRLELPLQKSRCACPAGGMCRHVLAAVLALRDEPHSDAPSAEILEEIASLDLAVLRRAAGKALWERAAGYGPVDLEALSAREARFRLPREGVEGRYLAGLGLVGMTCSCPSRKGCWHRLAALLSGRGVVPAPERSRALDAATLRSASVALEDLLRTGLCRLSPASVERLRTAAASAHAADLPRLAGLLRSLAGQVDLYLARDARAEPGRLLSAAARAGALLHALGSGRPVDGEHRSKYAPVAHLELAGLGLSVWRTAAGWAGLTVYFRGADAFYTWSETRRTPFDPAHRLAGEGPWSGADAPVRLPGRSLTLAQARVSPQGRISQSQQTQATMLGPADLLGLPATDRWSDLLEVALGWLAESRRVEALVWLAPARLEPAAFDRLRQETVRLAADRTGHSLPLRLPFRGEGPARALERFQPRGPCRVLGRLTWVDGVGVEPITLVDSRQRLHLSLLADGGEPTAGPPEALRSVSPSGRALLRAEDALSGWAEAGLANPPPLEPGLPELLERAGFERCSQALRELSGPRELLRAAWLVARTAEQLAVREAFSAAS